MSEPVLDIDVSKATLDVIILRRDKPRFHQVANSAEGWCALIEWLHRLNFGRVHACLEATGQYSLGVALALHEAGHVVSVINPAQISDLWPQQARPQQDRQGR